MPPASIAAEPLIASEGQIPTGLLLVRSGFARVSRRHGHGEQTRRLHRQRPGLRLGRIRRSHVAPAKRSRSAIRSVPSATSTSCASPPTSSANVVLPASTAQALIHSAECPDSRVPTLGCRQADDRPRTLDFLADNRFFNGTATMVIDLDRCTRCDDCVRACAATHDNNPRFLRHGPTAGRHDGRQRLHALRRSGLHDRLPDRRDPPRLRPASCDQRPDLHRLRDLCQQLSVRRHPHGRDSRRGRRISRWTTNQPIVKATKCDLCSIKSPARRASAPVRTTRLVRIDMSDEAGLASWLGR